MSFYTEIQWDQLIPPPTEVDNSHRDYVVFAIVLVLAILTTIVVASRLTYKYVAKKFGAEDYAILFAWLMYVGWTIMAEYMILYSGIDKPIGEITYGEFIVFYEGVFVSEWMYPFVSASIRISILLFYRSIFAIVSRFYSASLWVLIGMQVVYVIGFTILPGFFCSPIQDGWEPMKRMTSCTDLFVSASTALYACSFAFDVILLIFPIYATRNLKMSVKKRLGVVLIFALGASAGVVAGYKLAMFLISVNDWSPPSPDWFNYQAAAYVPVQYNAYGRMFWIPTQVEPTVALIGTSLPALLQIYGAASLRLSQYRSSRDGSAPTDSGSYKGSASSRNAASDRNSEKDSRKNLSDINHYDLEFSTTPTRETHSSTRCSDHMV